MYEKPRYFQQSIGIYVNMMIAWLKIEGDELFIEASKTDQYQDGSWVVIARSDLATCPVAILERYMK